jgi:hypothetical protein
MLRYLKVMCYLFFLKAENDVDFEVLSNLHAVPSCDLMVLRETQRLCAFVDSDSVD